MTMIVVNIHEAEAKLSEYLDAVAGGVTKLPSLHGDPFDRLLVSQAIVHGLIILTPDPVIARYPARTMW